jgi:hypothetical protein
MGKRVSRNRERKPQRSYDVQMIQDFLEQFTLSWRVVGERLKGVTTPSEITKRLNELTRKYSANVMPDFGPDNSSGRAENEVRNLIEWYLGIEAKEVSDSMRQLQNTLGWAFEAATHPVDAPLVCAIPLSLVEDLKNNIEQGAVRHEDLHA